jgi:hypothetical protein
VQTGALTIPSKTIIILAYRSSQLMTGNPKNFIPFFIGAARYTLIQKAFRTSSRAAD